MAIVWIFIILLLTRCGEEKTSLLTYNTKKGNVTGMSSIDELYKNQPTQTYQNPETFSILHKSTEKNRHRVILQGQSKKTIPEIKKNLLMHEHWTWDESTIEDAEYNLAQNFFTVFYSGGGIFKVYWDIQYVYEEKKDPEYFHLEFKKIRGASSFIQHWIGSVLCVFDTKGSQTSLCEIGEEIEASSIFRTISLEKVKEGVILIFKRNLL